MARKTLIQYLDAGALWTGIPQLVEQAPARRTRRRRSLRWSSAAVLVLALAGFAMGLTQLHPRIGSAVQSFGFIVSLLLPAFGPLKPWGSQGKIDEYDRDLRTKAYLAALTVLGMVAVIGSFVCAFLAASQHWNAQITQLMFMHMGYFLASMHCAAPTCYASWTQRPLSDDL